MKIAVIEDDKALNLLITKTLSSYYEVKSFYCIEDVKEEFDLYIIDIKLQKHSGLELLKRIKGKSIVITAYASEEIIKEIFNLGASDFIKKPIFKEELLYKIKKLFPSAYKIKDYEFSPENFTLKKENISITLTEKETAFLMLFTKKEFVTFDEIYQAIEKEGSALYTFLTRLKNKTGLEFENIKGLGYRLKM